MGKKFEYQYIWDTFACVDTGKEDVVMQQLSHYMKDEESINSKRRSNYEYVQKCVGTDKTFFPLKQTEVPGAFILKIENEKRMREISAFVRSFGVECGNFYHNSAIFFPIHQNLSEGHFDYILGSVRAMYREGSGLEYLKHTQ